MESFDPESFVNRLVEDGPSPRRTDVSGRWGDSISSAKVEEGRKRPVSSPCAAWDEYEAGRLASLLELEVSRYVGPGYLSGNGGLGVLTPERRASMVDGLIDLHAAASAVSGGEHPLSLEALFLSVNVLDRFLSTPEGSRVASSAGWWTMEIAGIACLGLASKYEDTRPPSLLELAFAATLLKRGAIGGSCRERVGEEGLNELKDEIIAMEQDITSAVEYRLTVSSYLTPLFCCFFT